MWTAPVDLLLGVLPSLLPKLHVRYYLAGKNLSSLSPFTHVAPTDPGMGGAVCSRSCQELSYWLVSKYFAKYLVKYFAKYLAKYLV